VPFSTEAGCAVVLDEQDPLARFRRRFCMPQETIYMDGNSLGLLSVDAEETLLAALSGWRNKAVGGWLDAGPPWFTLGEDLGRMQASIVGAEPDEVVVTGSTTVNLHNLLGGFYRPGGRRKRILADELNFPSDLYAIRGHLGLRGMDTERDLELVPSRDGRMIKERDVIGAMGPGTAVAVLPSVLYRSGQLLDVEGLTAAAHRAGAVIGFDLSHSVGIVPHKLHDWDVDFAVWCNYKYLNGGPGCTAGIYVNRRHFGSRPGMQGWWGYRKDRQFDMLPVWEGAPGAGAWQVGTIPVLATAPLAGAMRLVLEAGIEAIRAKSLLLTDYLMFLADETLCGPACGFAVGTPRDPSRRGGHVALEHPEALRITKALRARGVVPDFRPPNVVRLAPAPLYTSFQEVRAVIEHLAAVVRNVEYKAFAPTRDRVS